MSNENFSLFHCLSDQRNARCCYFQIFRTNCHLIRNYSVFHPHVFDAIFLLTLLKLYKRWSMSNSASTKVQLKSTCNYQALMKSRVLFSLQHYALLYKALCGYTWWVFVSLAISLTIYHLNNRHLWLCISSYFTNTRMCKAKTDITDADLARNDLWKNSPNRSSEKHRRYLLHNCVLYLYNRVQYFIREH